MKYMVWEGESQVRISKHPCDTDIFWHFLPPLLLILSKKVVTTINSICEIYAFLDRLESFVML